MLFCVVFVAISINAIQEVYSDYSEECGHQATFDKILNGEVTAIDEFPWMALLEYKTKEGKKAGFGCSGVLIDNRYVLTAAHCIKDMNKRNLELYSVRLGEYNTSSEIDCVEMFGVQDCADPPQDIPVESWVIHPNNYKHINDIALIKLLERANLTDFVRTICLPSANSTEDVGQILVAAGWGRTEKEHASSIKLKVSVPIVPFTGCYEKYKPTNTILNNSQHMCAGSVLGEDTCTGDSGGPLMSQWGDGRWKAIGIISTGNSCGLKDWPAVFMRVAYYRDWILEQMKIL